MVAVPVRHGGESVLSPIVTLGARRLVPLVVLVAVACALLLSRGSGRPAKGDEEVFVQAAYLMKAQHLGATQAVAKAAQNEYAWVTPEVAQRVRSKGDIQTYALLQVWRYAPDFRVGPSPWGGHLYVESRSISTLGFLAFLATILI